MAPKAPKYQDEPAKPASQATPYRLGLSTKTGWGVIPEENVYLKKFPKPDVPTVFDWTAEWYGVAVYAANGLVSQCGKDVQINLSVFDMHGAIFGQPGRRITEEGKLVQRNPNKSKYYFFSAIKFHMPGSYRVVFEAISKKWPNILPYEITIVVHEPIGGAANLGEAPLSPISAALLANGDDIELEKGRRKPPQTIEEARKVAARIPPLRKRPRSVLEDEEVDPVTMQAPDAMQGSSMNGSGNDGGGAMVQVEKSTGLLGGSAVNNKDKEKDSAKEAKERNVVDKEDQVVSKDDAMDVLEAQDVDVGEKGRAEESEKEVVVNDVVKSEVETTETSVEASQNVLVDGQRTGKKGSSVSAAPKLNNERRGVKEKALMAAASGLIIESRTRGHSVAGGSLPVSPKGQTQANDSSVVEVFLPGISKRKLVIKNSSSKKAAVALQGTAAGAEVPPGDYKNEVAVPKAKGVTATTFASGDKLYKIFLPAKLMKFVENDFQFVVGKGLVHNLPAASTVAAILDGFKNAVLKKDDMMERDIVRNFSFAFDDLVHITLLYPSERYQYQQLCCGEKKVAAKNVYGCYHLLRLLIALPGMFLDGGTGTRGKNSMIYPEKFNNTVRRLVKYIETGASRNFPRSYTEAPIPPVETVPPVVADQVEVADMNTNSDMNTNNDVNEDASDIPVAMDVGDAPAPADAHGCNEDDGGVEETKTNWPEQMDTASVGVHNGGL